MKKLLLILLITSSTFAQQNESGWLFINTETIPRDKQLHGAVGLFTAATTYSFTYGITKGNRKKSKIYAIVVPSLIGLGKELVDSKKGGSGFDLTDLGYTVGGAVLMTYTIDFLVGIKNRRKEILITKTK